jgi:uncharacterized membrane protein YuzA (DUF378 family)
MLLRLMGFLAPPANAPWYLKARGFAIILLLVIVLLAIGFGIVTLVALPFGGTSTLVSVLLGIVVIAAILGVLTLFGRRRQATAREKARAAQGG